MKTSPTLGLLAASLKAYGAFVGVWVVGVVLIALWKPWPRGVAVSRVASGLALAPGFGLILLAALLVVHRPVLMRLAGVGILRTRMQSALLGGLLAIVPFAGAVFLLRDGETLSGLLAFWTRMPAELAFGVLPYVVSGALFGAQVRRLAVDEGRHPTRGT